MPKDGSPEFSSGVKPDYDNINLTAKIFAKQKDLREHFVEEKRMYAVIDISSTSVSMLVCGKDGAHPAYKYRESLSALSFTEGGKLTEHGVEKLCDKISIFQDQCKKLGVEKLYVVSTAAMRFIDNAEEVFKAIRAKTGAVVNQIDGETEAYCDLVANEKFRSMEKPVIIDIGGASIEMCDLSKGGKEGIYCLNFGALTLQRKFVKSVYPDKEECSKIKKFIKKSLAKADVPPFDGGTAVLVGATTRSVYEIYRDYYDIEVSENMTIELEKLKKLAKKLIEAPDRSHLLIKNAPEKIYFIVVALITLVQLLKKFGFTSIAVSDAGVKEGYLKLALSGEVKAEISPFFPERPVKEIKSAEELVEHIKLRQKAGKAPVKKRDDKPAAEKSEEKPAEAAKPAEKPAE